MRIMKWTVNTVTWVLAEAIQFTVLLISSVLDVMGVDVYFSRNTHVRYSFEISCKRTQFGLECAFYWREVEVLATLGAWHHSPYEN